MLAANVNIFKNIALRIEFRYRMNLNYFILCVTKFANKFANNTKYGLGTDPNGKV